MIGILVITHGDLGEKFIETARLIGLSSEEAIRVLSLDPTKPAERLRDQVAQSVKELNKGDGVLILTDLFGGTPTNMATALLKKYGSKLEVVTGLNLAMVIKAINERPDRDLVSLAQATCEAGRDNIFRAGELLRQRTARRTAGE
jgi:mannose PTS system EIIA component